MTELKKKTKVKHITLPKDKRILFVSDIHGDVDTLKAGLEKVGFSKEDYLFVIGDMCEKGDPGKNLECFRYLMELSKLDNVICMSGNCDEVFRFMLPEDQDKNFLWYVVERKHSILNDIAAEMGYPISMEMDVRDFVNQVTLKYPEFFEFMDSLYDLVFINDEIVLVHGGIDDIHNIPEYALPMLKYDNYYRYAKQQEKVTIVGHYPTSNYRPDISCVNPLFGSDKRIISIDGGNHIVKGGQINILILESLERMRFTFQYTDHYPKYIMKQDVDYDHPNNPVSVSFGDNEVEIIDSDLDFTLVRHISTNEDMWVHSSYVYQDIKTGKYYAYDASNTFISVRKNEEISIIKKAMPYSVIKRNGYIGLIETRYINDED